MHRTLMQIWITIIVVLSSLACAQPTPITVIVTATPTNTPLPTVSPRPTPTPLPLHKLDIGSLLVQDGDLPAGYSGAQIRDEAPGMFSACPVPALAAYRQLAKDEETVGGVTVLLYESAEDIADAYAFLADGMTSDDPGIKTYETSDVGDKALVSSLSLTLLGETHENLDLLFTRCHALVHVRLSDTLDADAIVAYGKRLDARLQSLVCRE